MSEYHTKRENADILIPIVKEMIKSYSSWPIMARGDRTYAPRVAKWLAGKLEELGYCQIPELTVLEVSSHSESISCPHCGEEFGIESGIETAHENQFRHTKRELGE